MTTGRINQVILAQESRSKKDQGRFESRHLRRDLTTKQFEGRHLRRDLTTKTTYHPFHKEEADKSFNLSFI